MYTLFVCGTPHNKKGFELSELDGNNIPSNMFKYIDIYDPDKMKSGNTSVIQKVKISNNEYTLLVSYEGINPSDQKTSRGAYIAVGILAEAPISLTDSIKYFCEITTLHTYLKIMRDERNAFNTQFDISVDLKSVNHKCDHVAFLSNITFKLSNSNESKRVVFNDISNTNNIQGINSELIDNEISKLKESISHLKDKLEDEEIAHQETRKDYEDKIKNLQSYKQQNIDNSDQKDYRRALDLDSNRNISKNSTIKQSYDNPVKKVRPKSSYESRKADKKSFSMIKTILISFIIILVLIFIYIGYDIFGGNNISVDIDKKYDENTTETKGILLDTMEENIITIEEPKIQPIELEKKRRSNTLEKLKEWESK